MIMQLDENRQTFSSMIHPGYIYQLLQSGNNDDGNEEVVVKSQY